MLLRHKRLVGVLLALISFAMGIGCYLYCIVHFHHIASLFIVSIFVFLVIIPPAICYSWNFDDDQFVFKNLNMSEENYLNGKDCGRVSAGFFYLMTYVPPYVWWYTSGGANPQFGGVVSIFLGNMFMGISAVGWIVLFAIK